MKNTTKKTLLSFMVYSEAVLSSFASAVITAITNNIHFPSAQPQLGTLVTAQNAYVASLAIAKDGSRMQMAEKNVCKNAVLAALRELCSTVNFVAQGDRVMLLSSGFELTKDTSTPVVIEQPTNVIVTYGANSGEMDINVEGTKGHRGLVVEYAIATASNFVAEEATWISKPSGTTRCTLVNMPVGKNVWIRIGISGARKQLVYTTPVAKLVA